MKAIRLVTALAWLLVSDGTVYAQDNIGPAEGQTAPEFNLTDLEGQRWSLSGLREKGHVMVLFWSTHCPFCHAMIPLFQDIDRDYKAKGLSFVAVNIGVETRNEVYAYVLENDIEYLVLNQDDGKEELAETWHLLGTPTIQVIAPDGTVKYRGHFLPPDLDALLK